ncbi:MAG TPA: plastocyanin/azurin family copper-binding protein [Solirubrobacteraceae bacterium]|nr:plastocyanin/azurin family copper-binding protein [Solirubrobacteraceae bacterium]
MRAATAVAALVCVTVALCGCGSSTGAASSKTGSSKGSPGATSRASIHINTTPRFASPPAGAPVRSGLVQIAYRNIAIAPDAIRVKAGTTVKWTNYDPIEHNVTSVSGPQTLRSRNFGQGGTYEAKLTRPGVVHYVSTTQPTTMNGTIEVVR